MPANSTGRFAQHVLLLVALVLPTMIQADSRSISVTIDASQEGPPISRYVYGQFLDHIGDIVNDGLWAEMLDDRKFYHPITSAPPAQAASGPGPRRRPSQRWTPIGDVAGAWRRPQSTRPSRSASLPVSALRNWHSRPCPVR
jgi:hypothetical protein